MVLFLQKVPEPPPSQVIRVPGARASLEIQDREKYTNLTVTLLKLGPRVSC